MLITKGLDKNLTYDYNSQPPMNSATPSNASDNMMVKDLVASLPKCITRPLLI